MTNERKLQILIFDVLKQVYDIKTDSPQSEAQEEFIKILANKIKKRFIIKDRVKNESK